MSHATSRRLGLLGATLLAVVAVGCGTAASTTSGTTTTTTLIGTLVQGGLTTENVTAAGTGELDVQLSNLTPQTTITVGLGIGQAVNGQCAPLTYADDVRVGSVLPLEVVAGSYCIVVQDVGNVTGSDTFTLTVTHP